MNNIKKIISITLASICILMLMPTSDVHATVKKISGVSITVSNGMEAGDYVSNDNVVIDNTSGSVGDGQITVSSNNEKYYIESAKVTSSTSNELKIGDEIKLKVVIVRASSDYKFSGTYNADNVTIKGGTYASSSRTTSKLTVNIKLKAIKGQYDAPENAEWSTQTLGRAKWNHPTTSSGYYELVLYRNNQSVTKVESTQGNTYNFYPYMTQQGTYTFKVRVIPKDGTSYGKNSEWTVSDDLDIDKKNVSDGTGQSASGSESGTTAGWIQTSGKWYYKYPDGTIQKDGWVKVNNKWYLFDKYGAMLTGWQTRNGQTYFINSDGDMFAGWLQQGSTWYYLNPQENTDTYGAMLSNGWVEGNNKMRYHLAEDGSMSTGWTKVDGNWYYFYPGNGNMAANTTIDTFYIGADGIWRR